MSDSHNNYHMIEAKMSALAVDVLIVGPGFGWKSRKGGKAYESSS